MPARTYFAHTASPVGRLLLVSDGSALTGLYLTDRPAEPGWVEDAGPFEQAVAELGEYFAGTRTAFTVPAAPAGTPFQRAAWDALRTIPYGQTVSYAEQARRLGRPAAARAVGAANGRNPVSIVLPCHRVIGAGGKLVGYGGGLAVKATLLALEGAVPR